MYDTGNNLKDTHCKNHVLQYPIHMCIYIYIYYRGVIANMYVSHTLTYTTYTRKLKFTKRTSTNLGRYHTLIQKICMAKVEGCQCCLKDNYAKVWHDSQIRYCYLGGSHRLPPVPPIYENQCSSLACFLFQLSLSGASFIVAHDILYPHRLLSKTEWFWT